MSVPIDRGLGWSQWGVAPVPFRQLLGIAGRAEVDDSQRLDRELGTPRLLDDGLQGRSHVCGTAGGACRGEVPLPDEAAGPTCDGDGLGARWILPLTGEVLVLPAGGAADGGHGHHGTGRP